MLDCGRAGLYAPPLPVTCNELLTILVRELRVLCRKRGTYGMRIALALPVLLTGVLYTFAPIYTDGGIMTAQAAVCQILFAFGAALAVSDAISSERREGTLGLLIPDPPAHLPGPAGQAAYPHLPVPSLPVGGCSHPFATASGRGSGTVRFGQSDRRHLRRLPTWDGNRALRFGDLQECCGLGLPIVRHPARSIHPASGSRRSSRY